MRRQEYARQCNEHVIISTKRKSIPRTRESSISTEEDLSSLDRWLETDVLDQRYSYNGKSTAKPCSFFGRKIHVKKSQQVEMCEGV